MRWIRGGRERAVALAVATLAAATAVAACDGPRRGPRWDGAGRTEPYRGGTLTCSTSVGLPTLDPALAYDEAAGVVVSQMYERLVGYDAGTRLVPRLAERWTISADATVYEFILRAGLRYADGRPIVAGDLAYALSRVLRLPDSPFAGRLAGVDGAAAYRDRTRDDVPGLEVVDDRTLRIHLIAPDASFLSVLAMRFATPLRRDFVEAHGGDLRRAVLASGPFTLERWDEGQRIVLVRNPAYWDPARPYLDRVVMIENLPQDSAFLMFETGALDILDHVPLPDWLWISEHPGWRPYVHTQAQLSATGSRMNVRVPPFDDVRVRRALNYALDKRHAVKLLGGLATPAHGMLPPGLDGRAELEPYPYDPARARALLAEAGYPHGFATEYVTLDNDIATRMAQSLQADLAAVGVRVSIRVLSWNAYLAETTRADGAPFSMTEWMLDYPDPSNAFDVRFHSSSITPRDSNNDSFYANPALDGVLDAARRERDPAARTRLYQRADRILYDDAPWIWGYHATAMEVTQPYVKGFAPHPVLRRDFRDTWLDLDAHGRRVPR